LFKAALEGGALVGTVGLARTPAGRLTLALQGATAWLLAPLWVPIVALLLRLVGYRIRRRRALRRQYRGICRTRQGPLLICANHLTMIDSALIAWALGSPWWYVTHFSTLPWNLPERRNFGASWPSRILMYVMKCLPITRGGDRAEMARTLQRFTRLLARGDVGLVFPEGGRSRTGRVETEAATYGVGRIIRALPGGQVLCVYLRGERQATFSDLPRCGERFYVEVEVMPPASPAAGLRAERDLARQIVAQLAAMERRYFDGRQ
jgi:1-acyl-sn-glycerol-3-phosphate acyltransferase